MRLAKICLCIALVPTAVVFAQEHYQGPLQLGLLEGDAEFSYKVKRKDTIFEGPFRLQGSDLAAMEESNISFFSIDGEFDDNLPVGEWQLRQGEFKSTGKGTVEDHFYRMRISGREHFSKGSLHSGKPDGEWRVYSWQIQNSEIRDSIHAGRFSFKKGIANGRFEIHGDTARLIGNFDEDGFADSTWKYVSDNLPHQEEQWHFSQGQLQSIAPGANKEADSLYSFVSEGKAEEIEMDSRYFHILEIKRGISTSDEPPLTTSSDMQNLFLAGLGHFYRTDSVLSVLSEASFMPAFKARLLKYAYTEDEIQTLESISENLQEAQGLYEELQDNAQLNLLKLSHEEIYFYLEAASAIERHFLRPSDTLLHYYQQGMLEFLPREQMVNKLFPKINSLKVHVPLMKDDESTTRTYALQDTALLDDNRHGLAAVNALAKISLASLQDIQTQLDLLINEMHREKELVQLEDSLMAQYAELNSVLDSLDENVKLENDGVWSALRELADNELNRYSAIDHIGAQTQKAKELIGCFQEVGQLARGIARTPSRRENVERAYTQKVWNPYTYNYMRETVKKRILNAYRDILLPHFLEEAGKSPTCENISKTHSQLDRLHQRMRELRTANTNKLERKLKREEDPQEVIRLFDLEAK